MRVVQVVVDRSEFPDTLQAIRDWLDRNNRPLVRFETASEGNTITMKLYFDDEALGKAFRDAFGGSTRVRAS